MDEQLPLTPVVQVVAGLLILVLGRKLFWVFVGVVGFFFGLQYGMNLFRGISDGVVLLLSIVLGLACAGLTILLQRVAVGIAGGCAGGLIAIRLAELDGVTSSGGLGAAFVAGALLAAVLLAALFDPALIILSAVMGAVMVAEALPLDQMVEPVVCVFLFLVGVVVQIRMMRTGRAMAAN